MTTTHTTRRLGDAPAADLLDPEERMSVDELQALQLERLQWTLRHAYDNVPFYRQSFDAHGVHPDDCRSLTDLAKFPTTTKADLRDNYPFGMFAVPQDQVRRIHASSGTTGRPTVVGYTARDIDTWATVMARSIRAAGGRPGHKVHNAYGYGLFTGGLGAHYGIEKLGATAIPISGGMTPRQVQLITDFQPEIIMVTPSYMLTVIDEFEKQGLDPAASSLQVGIFGAEPWTEQMRLEIEDRMDMHAVDIYGLSEVMGPGRVPGVRGDQGRAARLGGPLLPGDRRPAGSDVAAPLRDGEEGELLFTSLTKEALPIIRYRTRDLTRLLPGHRPTRHAPHAEDHRPQRRHDHPPRGERVPHPDRGDRAAHPRAGPALPAGAHHRGPDGRADGPGRGPPRLPGRAARGGDRRGGLRDQGERRGDGARRGRRAGHPGALGGEAAAAQGPPPEK